MYFACEKNMSFRAPGAEYYGMNVFPLDSYVEALTFGLAVSYIGILFSK